jgi:hypothetical protein
MQTQKKETQNSNFDCTSRNKHNPTRHANRALITITINTRTVKASTVAQTETISMCIANISDHAEQHINEISKHDIVSSKQIIQQQHCQLVVDIKNETRTKNSRQAVYGSN